MATKADKAVDIFLSSIESLPGKFNPMVVLNKTSYNKKVKRLTDTLIKDLPTQILRDVAEDKQFAEAFEKAKRRAFSNLFRRTVNAKSKNRKTAAGRLPIKGTKKKKTS